MIMRDVERAKDVLLLQEFTCVFVRGENVITSLDKGISPVLSLIQNNTILKDYSVADKVVGKAAALLFVHAGIAEVYADVISRAARDVLLDFHIPHSYSRLVNHIINRSGTGICPMEETVQNIHSPDLALPALISKLKSLKMTGI